MVELGAMVGIDALWDEIALTVGAVLILLAIVLFRQTRRFVQRCLLAEGTVIGHTEEEDDSGVYYFTVIGFVDSSGASHQLTGSASREPPAQGGIVPIMYDPTDPTNAWVRGKPAPWVLPWFVAILGVAAVVVGLGMRFGWIE